MKVNRTGITRIVFIFDKVVIKVPNFLRSWQFFIEGVLSNLLERDAWKYATPEQRQLLCPVKWCSWGGWILVMYKADVKSWEIHIDKMEFNKIADPRLRKEMSDALYKKWFDAGLEGDDKADNYGIFQGRIVKIDYGNW